MNATETMCSVQGDQSWHRNCRILVVEDHPPCQALARCHLERAGYSVEVVPGGISAISAVSKNAYDLILMDVDMPDMNGIEATRRIRSEESPAAHVPILGVTGTVDPGTLQECRVVGMNDIINKPLRQDAFLASVEKWVLHHPAGESDGGVNWEPLSKTIQVNYDHMLPMDVAAAVEEFGDREIVATVATQFIEIVQRQKEVMIEALGRGDADIVRREAHAIKGGAGTLEARPLANAAARIEELAKLQKLNDVPDVLDRLSRELDRLAEHVETELLSGG